MTTKTTELGILYEDTIAYIAACEVADNILTRDIPIMTRAQAVVFTYARWSYVLDHEDLDSIDCAGVVMDTDWKLCGGCIGYRAGFWRCGNGLCRRRGLSPWGWGGPSCPVEDFCTALCWANERHPRPDQVPELLWMAYHHVVVEAECARLSISEIPTPDGGSYAD